MIEVDFFGLGVREEELAIHLVREVRGKGVDLNAHLGHKVEITGEEASEADEKGGAKKEAKESSHKHVKVSSLRHIAATCP